MTINSLFPTLTGPSTLLILANITFLSTHHFTSALCCEKFWFHFLHSSITIALPQFLGETRVAIRMANYSSPKQNYKPTGIYTLFYFVVPKLVSTLMLKNRSHQNTSPTCLLTNLLEQILFFFFSIFRTSLPRESLQSIVFSFLNHRKTNKYNGTPHNCLSHIFLII